MSEIDPMIEQKVDEREALLKSRGYPEVMRSGQAARCLGISKAKLHESYKAGQINGTDTGTEFRFDRRDIARHWVEGQRPTDW